MAYNPITLVGPFTIGQVVPITFDLEKPEDLYITVDGVVVSSSTYTWNTSTSIQLGGTFPLSGLSASFARRSDSNDLPGLLVGGAALDYDLINANDTRLLMLAQEVRNNADSAVAVVLDAQDDVTAKYTEIVTKHGDVVTKHSDVVVKHGDVSTKSADVTVKYNQIDIWQSQVASNKSAAENAALNAINAVDGFDDIYLGPKSSSPSLNNDGDPLSQGSLYFNTALSSMMVYGGGNWRSAYLSDIDAVATATSISVLKAYDTTTGKSVLLTLGKRTGFFVFLSGDYSSQIADDTLEGMFIKANSVASNLGAWVRQSDFVSPLMFGAAHDGVTNDAPAWNAAWKVCQKYFTEFQAGRGDVYFTSQVTIDFAVSNADTNRRPVHMDFSGSVIRTSGAISGLKFFGFSYMSATAVGININHLDNATATAGIEIVACGSLTLINPKVFSRGNVVRTMTFDLPAGNIGYASLRVRESEATDPVFAGQPAGTGGYFNLIINPVFKSYLTTNVGVHVSGQNNKTDFIGGEWAGQDIAVLLTNTPGQNDGPNSINFISPSMEFLNTAFKAQNTHTDNYYASPGVNVISPRFEGVGTKLDLTRMSQFHPQAGWNFSNETIVGTFSVAEYANVSENVRPNTDTAHPANSGYKPFKFNYNPFLLKVTTAGMNVLETIGGLGKGIGFRYGTAAGALAGYLGLGTTDTTVLRLAAASNSKLDLAGVKTISSVAAREGKNFAGTLTVTGAATTGVWTFGTAEPDATYKVHLTPVSFTGTPAAGSNSVKSVSKATGSVTATVEAAPGVGNSVTFDVLIFS